MSEDIPMKKCTGPCGQEYPATEKYWHRQAKGKYGFTSKCKTCTSDESKTYYNSNKEKHLAKHDEWRKTHPDYHKQYYQNNKDTIRAKNKNYNKEHAEEININKKDYYKKHRDEILENRKNYQKRNKDKIHTYRKNRYQSYRLFFLQEKKKYYQENKERINKQKKQYSQTEKGRIASRIQGHNKRARNRSVHGTHTHEQIQNKLKQQKHKCYYCKAQLKKTKGKYLYHIEHTFPLSRVAGTDIPANSIDYLVLACPTCNLSKHDKFPWEWAQGGRLL